MNADIQNIRDLQRAVVQAILAHPVRESKYGKGLNKEDQDRRSAALVPLWHAFLNGAKSPADRLRRQRQLSEANRLPWYLGLGAEEVAEAYFARAAEVSDEEVEQEQAVAAAQAEGAAYIESSRQTDALARLPAKERQAIAREKRLAYALRKGAVPAEKGLVHLFWQGSRADKVSIVQGRIDYRVLWVMAVCARRLLEESGGPDLNPSRRPEPVFATAEELEKTAAELKALSRQEASRAAPSIAFTDSDFRRILGRPELRSKKIYDIVNYLPTIILDFTNFPGLSVQDAEGNERWIEYTNLRTNFVTIFSEKKVERKRTRGSHPGQETLYEIYFTTDFGLAFLANMKRCQFVLMPRSLFQLSARAQELFFAMSWRPRNEFKLSSLAALFGWVVTPKNRCHYKEAIRRLLDELKGAGFVSSWTERENRDGETVYAARVAREYLTSKKVAS